MSQFHNARLSLHILLGLTGINLNGWKIEYAQCPNDTLDGPEDILLLVPEHVSDPDLRRAVCCDLTTNLSDYGFETQVECIDKTEYRVKVLPYTFAQDKINNGEVNRDGSIIAAGPLVEGKHFVDVPYRVVLRVTKIDEYTGRIKELTIHTQFINHGTGRGRGCNYASGTYCPVPEDPTEYRERYREVVEKFHTKVLEKL